MRAREYLAIGHLLVDGSASITLCSWPGPFQPAAHSLYVGISNLCCSDVCSHVCIRIGTVSALCALTPTEVEASQCSAAWRTISKARRPSLVRVLGKLTYLILRCICLADHDTQDCRKYIGIGAQGQASLVWQLPTGLPVRVLQSQCMTWAREGLVNNLPAS